MALSENVSETTALGVFSFQMFVFSVEGKLCEGLEELGCRMLLNV